MLPKAYAARMERLLGEEFPAYWEALGKPPVRGLRFLGGMGQEAFAAALPVGLSPIPYVPEGFYLEGEEKLGRHPLHHGGFFYLQEPGAMLPVRALPLRPGDRVLDLCAAPGGKSLQAAAAIGETGLLVANEIKPERCRVLAGNLERAGVKNAIVTCEKAERLAAAWPEGFDAVILDAPCSGEGMFRKEEGALAQWSQGLVERCAALQRELLAEAAKLVRPGGWLLYSTCTFSPEEDEENVAWFLGQGEFLLRPLPEGLRAFVGPGVGLEPCARFYPHVSPGEGQFAALMQRVGEEPRRDFPAGLGKPAQEAAEFLSQTLEGEPPAAAALPDGRLVIPPGRGLSPAGVTVREWGVPLGMAQKGRFVPSHWFFRAFGAGCRRKLSLGLGDPRGEAYLRGEERAGEGMENGYGAVLLEGRCLGGVRAAGGRCKNLYPKGLRNFR